MYVFDATPLIVLASVDRLDLVSALDDECGIPEPVREEVVATGLDAGYADARRIEQAIEAEQFSVEPAPDSSLVEKLGRADALSSADVAVLTVATEHDGVAVMDEQAGRAIASIEGIPSRGTAYVVLNAQAEGVLDAETARAVVDALLEVGWYCAPDLYAQIQRKIDAIETREGG